jgi:hypothetical protein
VPGVENYQRHPGKKLERVLAACEWEQIGDGLWWKGKSRLYVDAVGCFLYRLHSSQWVRVAGLSHARIRNLSERKIVFNDFILDLLSGQ